MLKKQQNYWIGEWQSGEKGSLQMTQDGLKIADAVNQMCRAQRRERFQYSDQLSLGSLIESLERVKDKTLQLTFDFEYAFPTTADSWRGSYDELAIGFEIADKPDQEPDVQAFLDYLKERVLNQTFTGWKGGDYIMTVDTPVWVANPGNSGETAVYSVKELSWKVVIITGLCEY